jgi:molybdenum cofactor cytidylyltransferase
MFFLHNDMNAPAIVILAAGASTRLGQPKQLLQYQGKSLIQRIAEIAVQVGRERVVVVLGAFAELVFTQIDPLPLVIRYNPEWNEGIASSIRKGLQTVLDFLPLPEAVLFAVCDQPHISEALFRDMLSARKATGKSIIACAYDGTLGTPVLFSRPHYDELLQLKGNEGAKRVIQRHPGSMATVSFPMGNVDIDTIRDYTTLQ